MRQQKPKHHHKLEITYNNKNTMAKEQKQLKRSGAGKGGFLANEKKSKKDEVPIGFAKIQKYNKMRLPDGTHKRKGMMMILLER